MFRFPLLTLALLGCPAPDDKDPTTTDETPEATPIGPDGGSVEASGAAVDVPAGALSEAVEIRIAVEDPGVALPDGWEAAGDVYAVTPHGTTFEEPVTLTFPDAGVDEDLRGLLVLSDPSDTTWEELTDVEWTGGNVVAETDHLSFWRVARRTSPRPCDHDAATAALASIEVATARDIYEGCVDDFPDDTQARFGYAITRLLLANRWSPVATVADWCGETVQLDETLYGGDGFVAGLRDAWDTTASTTTAEFAPFRGQAADVDMLTTAGVGRAWIDEVWTDAGSFEAVRVEIGESASSNTRLAFSVPSYELGEWSPDADYVRDFSFHADADLYPDYADRWFYGETATFTLTQMGDRTGDPVEIAYDITLREDCGGRSCGLLHFVGTISDEIDPNANDYDWPLEGRSSVCDFEDCASTSSIFPEVDYQCEVPDYASVYGLVDDLAAEFSDIAGDLHRAGADPGFSFLVPREALWFLNEDLVAGPTDAASIAAAADAAVAAIRLATMYDLVDASLNPGDFAGQITTWDEDWDTGGGGSDCSSERALGDKATFIGDQLDEHALKLRSNAAADAASDALDTLFTSLIAVLDGAPAVGIVTPDARAARGIIDAMRGDIAAAQASLGSTDPVALPSSPALKGTLGAFFADVPTRDSILDDLGIDAIAWAIDADQGTCENGAISFDEDFLNWASRGADAAQIPERLYENGFREDEIPSFADGELWDAAINDNDGWPECLRRDLKDALNGQ